MAEFVYVHQQPSGTFGHPNYAVTTNKNYSQTLVAGSVLAVHIKPNFERLLPGEMLPPNSVFRTISVGWLELTIIKSELEIYDEPRQSQSEDSGALYFGHSLDVKGHPQLGMLLQYLAGGKHTSAHSHDYEEIYVPLRGLASAFVLPDNNVLSLKAEEVHLSHTLEHQDVLTVPKSHYHPLSALTASLTLIVTDQKAVKDQVYGTRNNHHKKMPFEQFYLQFVNRA